MYEIQLLHLSKCIVQIMLPSCFQATSSAQVWSEPVLSNKVKTWNEVIWKHSMIEGKCIWTTSNAKLNICCTQMLIWTVTWPITALFLLQKLPGNSIDPSAEPFVLWGNKVSYWFIGWMDVILWLGSLLYFICQGKRVL